MWRREERLRASHDGQMENIRTLISRISLIMKVYVNYIWGNKIPTFISKFGRCFYFTMHGNFIPKKWNPNKTSCEVSLLYAYLFLYFMLRVLCQENYRLLNRAYILGLTPKLKLYWSNKRPVEKMSHTFLIELASENVNELSREFGERDPQLKSKVIENATARVRTLPPSRRPERRVCLVLTIYF